MAHHYLAEQLGEPAVGDVAVLEGAEARHAVTVSRLAVGERVSLGDGAGLVVAGEIVSAAPTRVEVAVDAVTRHPRRDPALVLVQALAKGDRDEAAVQAATELGVDAVVPWQADRSISRWQGPKIAKGQARWEAIVREATKQSLRAWIPDVLPLVSTSQLARLTAGLRLVVLVPEGSTPLVDLRPDGRDIGLVVGPEGGISPSELAALEAAGAELVRMGPEVLRTSTAGPAAIAVLSAALGRWDA